MRIDAMQQGPWHMSVKDAGRDCKNSRIGSHLHHSCVVIVESTPAENSIRR